MDQPQTSLGLTLEQSANQMRNAAAWLRQSCAQTPEELSKKKKSEGQNAIWSSPAGKSRIAKRIARLLPDHATYVEPFVGSGAVLFAKEPSKREVINDADAEISQAFRLVKGLTSAKFAQLKRMDWVSNPATYKRVYGSKPTTDAAKLHRFLYTAKFRYGHMRGSSHSPSSNGTITKVLTRLEKLAPRLKNVTVASGDYERVIRKYDGKSTAFFLDPPYAGYDAKVGEGKFDEERFFKALKSIKGKWLMTYGIKGKLPKMLKDSGFQVRRFRTRRSIRSVRGGKGPGV